MPDYVFRWSEFAREVSSRSQTTFLNAYGLSTRTVALYPYIWDPKSRGNRWADDFPPEKRWNLADPRWDLGTSSHTYRSECKHWKSDQFPCSRYGSQQKLCFSKQQRGKWQRDSSYLLWKMIKKQWLLSGSKQRSSPLILMKQANIRTSNLDGALSRPADSLKIHSLYIPMGKSPNTSNTPIICAYVDQKLCEWTDLFDWLKNA